MVYLDKTELVCYITHISHHIGTTVGSFNTTCFASQQTISSNNECYVIALKQASGYNPLTVTRNGESVPATAFTSSTCYPDCFWQPMSDFIAATYDDYGQVELDQDPENLNKVKAFFNELPSYVYDIEQGENQYHDTPFKIADFQAMTLDKAWDYLWEAAVQEERVFVTGYNKNAPRNLTFGIISKQSYHALIAMMEELKGWDDKSNKREDYANRELERAVKTAAEISTKNAKGDATKDAKEADRFEEFMITDCMREMFKGGNVHGPNYNYRWERQNAIAKSILKERKIIPETMAAIVEDLKFAYVMRGLEYLNIKLSPIVYAGQDYDNSIGKAYAKFVRTVSAAVSKQQKKIYGE